MNMNIQNTYMEIRKSVKSCALYKSIRHIAEVRQKQLNFVQKLKLSNSECDSNKKLLGSKSSETKNIHQIQNETKKRLNTLHMICDKYKDEINSLEIEERKVEEDYKQYMNNLDKGYKACLRFIDSFHTELGIRCFVLSSKDPIYQIKLHLSDQELSNYLTIQWNKDTTAITLLEIHPHLADFEELRRKFKDTHDMVSLLFRCRELLIPTVQKSPKNKE